MVLRKLVDTAVQLSRLDKKGWDKLYFGIRRDIKLGIKHGFGGGSIVGSFIEDDGGGTDEDGKIQQQTPSGKFNKTHSGYPRWPYRQYSGRRRVNCRCRQYRKYKQPFSRRKRMYR